jgi:hypothetical protein
MKLGLWLDNLAELGKTTAYANFAYSFIVDAGGV